jgi:hypothetical protein
MFRKLDLFQTSGEGAGDTTLLRPLERDNLSHWTRIAYITITIYINIRGQYLSEYDCFQ